MAVPTAATCAPTIGLPEAESLTEPPMLPCCAAATTVQPTSSDVIAAATCIDRHAFFIRSPPQRGACITCPGYRDPCVARRSHRLVSYHWSCVREDDRWLTDYIDRG